MGGFFDGRVGSEHRALSQGVGDCGASLRGAYVHKDTEMIPHQFSEDIIIYPIADVHYGALEHNGAAWEAMCKEILAQPNAYVILNGDLINNATRSSVSNIFDETVRPRDQKRHMVAMLSPLRERILCITSGNHERRSIKDADDDPAYDIACKLDIEDLYRQNIAFLNVGMGTRADTGGANQSFRIAVTHGAGGGIYTGATVNRNERFGNVIDGLDCLVVGHTHKGVVSRPSKWVIDAANNQVVQRDYLVVSCVSWMEFGGYAAQKMLLPAAHSKPQKLILRAQNYRDKSHKASKRIEVVW